MTMEFKARVRQHGETVRERRQLINTEEATKHALVLPLLAILGFDVYDPRDVIPEFDADIANKKGEKVDYALCVSGKPTVFIECKSVGEQLDQHRGQLVRYFQCVSSAEFGVLTNGVIYRFYTDIEESNLMDQLPFLEFDITSLLDDQIEELRKFCKTEFDSEKIRVNASRLKHQNALTKVFQRELENPSDDLIRLLASQVEKKKMTAQVVEYFRDIVKSVIRSHISGLVRNRLESAMSANDQEQKAASATSTEPVLAADDNGIITTPEEIESYMIIKAILAMDPHSRGRIVYRDAKSYFSVLLDDNSRKPICRLILKESRKQILFCDAPENFRPGTGARTFETVDIQSIENIYEFADRLLKTFRYYEEPGSVPKSPVAESTPSAAGTTPLSSESASAS